MKIGMNGKAKSKLQIYKRETLKIASGLMLLRAFKLVNIQLSINYAFH